MFGSIKDDIQSTFRYGNMINKIIIVNVGVYMIFALFHAFAPTVYESVATYFRLPGDFMTMIKQPWSLITHMFFHEGLWHLVWNMVSLYVFGNILGDLIGDQKILPTYILGGLFGAFAYLIAFQFGFEYFPSLGYYALGASAAMLAVLFAAVATSPDYVISLLLIGPVRIKFIGLIILFFDIIGTRGMSNSGGHIMHLGGTVFGFLIIYLLRKGIDITSFTDFKRFNKSKHPKRNDRSRSPLVVSHRAPSRSSNVSASKDLGEEDIDRILEKIKKFSYESLTEREKEILYNASKK